MGPSKPSGLDGDCSLPNLLRVKYKIGKQIGEGNFATVKECIEKARKIRRALKIIEKSRCKGREQQVVNEIEILRRTHHINIVELVEEFITPTALYLVMELVTGGDLFESIAAATRYSEKDASGMMYHLACAVDYLHSLFIVHRDIKPENLLIHERADGTKLLKLGDFGLATIANKPLYAVCGTPTYVAPEVLAEIGYGCKVDIWATGVLMYVLLCGFPPFRSEADDPNELYDKILDGVFTFDPPYWNDISESAKCLLTSLLKVDPNERYSATQLLDYPWIAEGTTSDDDIRPFVAQHMHEFAKTSNRFTHLLDPGIAVIATTALDKGYLHYQSRKTLTKTREQ